MSLLNAIDAECWSRFPRASGDEPPTLLLRWVERKFSPRERG